MCNKKKLIRTFFTLTIFGGLFLLYCHIESRWIKTEKINLIFRDIPKSFIGKKIVFITDIHHGPFFSIERVQKLVERINKLNPDYIIMGGDYTHREPKYIEPLFNELKKIKSNDGIYAVLGNHDHWEDAELTKQMMLRNGIKICDNKSYWVKINDDSIKIGGVGDLWEDSQEIDSTIYDLKKTDFSILITHNPDYLESMPKDMIDFTLSGHSHGGQMTFFGMWAPMLPSKYGQKYRYGLKQFGDMKSYISSGIGTITPPLRFFCRPEIVLINLQNQ
ncbi:MAG: metallophosphoesterase [Bacteroidales bacterium]|nr:metallophosphoesterase [Bacteroidales bacterium]